jgi:hypothetical protein
VSNSSVNKAEIDGFNNLSQEVVGRDALIQAKLVEQLALWPFISHHCYHHHVLVFMD